MQCRRLRLTLKSRVRSTDTVASRENTSIRPRNGEGEMQDEELYIGRAGAGYWAHRDNCAIFMAGRERDQLSVLIMAEVLPLHPIILDNSFERLAAN